MDSKSKSSHSTALVLLNTRNIEGYQSINDMLNTKAKGPWGNKITFLHVPIPKLNETRISTPLEFIRDSHNIIKRKKQSFGVVLTGTLLDMEGKLRGQEVGRILVTYNLNLIMMLLITFFLPIICDCFLCNEYKHFNKNATIVKLVPVVAGSSQTHSWHIDKIKCSDFKLGWTSTADGFS